MVDGYNEKLGCFEQKERRTCETCYYEEFDESAYPCSRCVHNKPMDDMWQPKKKDLENDALSKELKKLGEGYAERGLRREQEHE